MLFYSLYALIGFALGVYVLYNLENTYLAPLLLVFLGIFIITSLIKRLRDFVLPILIIGIFSFAGLLSMEAKSRASEYTDEFVTVTGRVSEIPYKSESGMFCYTLNCKELSYAGNNENFENRILMYSENEYGLDDTVAVSGFLKLFDTERNEGCFNAYTYYKSIGIDYKISSLGDSFAEISQKSYSPYALMMRVRNKVHGIIDRGFSPDNGSVLKIILLNFKKELDSDFTNRLLNSGVLRCLYSPYFHLVLILSVLGVLKKKYPVHIITIIFLIIYLIINPYILTARKLFFFYIICEVLRLLNTGFRKEDVLWTCILILGLQNPYVLYNEGFLMSCSATAFIIIFFDKIYRKVSWINSHKAVVNICVMYFESVILLMPIAAFLFEGISLYSILISVVLLPIICVIYLISPLMIFEALAFSGIFKLITDNLVTFIRTLPNLIEKIPFSYIPLPRPPFILLLAILFLFSAFYKRKDKKSFSVLISISLGFLISFGIGEASRAGKINITFLNLAQGDSVLTDIPYKCTVLVDGGGSVEENSSYDVGARDVFPHLRHRNIKKLDYVFLSHYHKDHADGILSLMELVKIKNIFLPDCLQDDEYRVIIEKRAEELRIKLHYIKDTGTIELEEGLTAEILYFNKEAIEENDQSVVMRITYDDISCLYTGDITKTEEEKILATGVDLKADVLKVAHHGSYKSNSLEFLEAVSPEIAVASCTKENPYGFPSKETKDRFEILDIPFITTAEKGTVEIEEKFGRLVW